MKNIEYTKMAQLYDLFYANKNYKKEVDFICSFIDNNSCKILDAGCGTGNHAKILNDKGYIISGFDLSKDMVDIADSKVDGKFSQCDLLKFKSREKFDLIISFFAVFNHLKNYREFKTGLFNLKSVLSDNGKIIIDLHNPQKNGKKIESIDNVTRIMKWKRCKFLNKEYSKIIYIVDDKKLETKHVFKIYKLNKLRKLAYNLGFKKVEFYEDYNTNKFADLKSKNIQMVLEN